VAIQRQIMSRRGEEPLIRSMVTSHGVKFCGLLLVICGGSSGAKLCENLSTKASWYMSLYCGALTTEKELLLLSPDGWRKRN
jgi:hypothetical protein